MKTPLLYFSGILGPLSKPTVTPLNNEKTYLNGESSYTSYDPCAKQNLGEYTNGPNGLVSIPADAITHFRTFSVAKSYTKNTKQKLRKI